MCYIHRVYHERVEIARMFAWQKSCCEITRTLKRSVSSISEELKHNRFNSKYYEPEYADMQVQTQKQSRIRPITDNATIKAPITTYLKKRLVPDAIKDRAIF